MLILRQCHLSKMNLDIEKLRNSLCELMCAEVNIIARKRNLLLLETPFAFSDGDPYQLYIKELPGGILRLTDMGHTLMHLSYENDLDKFRDGTRGKLFEQIKSETHIEENNGEFFIDTPIANLGFNIFRLGQALTKINDLTFLNHGQGGIKKDQQH